MPTLVVGMRVANEFANMPTTSVGMAPITARLTDRYVNPALSFVFNSARHSSL
jgi:hypothetical protein